MAALPFVHSPLLVYDSVHPRSVPAEVQCVGRKSYTSEDIKTLGRN